MSCYPNEQFKSYRGQRCGQPVLLMLLCHFKRILKAKAGQRMLNETPEYNPPDYIRTHSGVPIKPRLFSPGQSVYVAFAVYVSLGRVK